ncbi:MAG TPA: precorrin-3B C(17)-methyltransferase [Thermosulfurimonas dismutans]|uniref:Precorrin-3B C(17)-methyltransferase n=1 Tax=Thermosulfurimonas dismutans TaxID=999894 RepID=A0A7C3H1A6_9BACT|nr:precorrin-3B C(17)-methyltransferase [Thermosulfurimonas dismutans]
MPGDRLQKIVLFPATARGHELAARLSARLPSSEIRPLSRGEVSSFWEKGNGLVFVSACGIAVRIVAPLLRHKQEDPAVVVVDETGRWVISLLSGHLGGANALARKIARLLPAEPVITTASDLYHLPALDLWAEETGAILLPPERIPAFTARYLSRGGLRVFREYPLPLPAVWEEVSEPEKADLIVSYRQRDLSSSQLLAVPRVLYLGLGFNRGTSAEAIEKAVRETLSRNRLLSQALRGVGTLEAKAREEGFLAFCRKTRLSIFPFSPEELSRRVKEAGLSISRAARQAVGAFAVAEPAALLAAGPGARLLVPKEKTPEVTVAVAEARQSPGKLFLVGIGTGDPGEMTPAARRALCEATHVVGYGKYLELVEDLLAEKEIYSTGMTREVDRAERALELALSGHRVALVSGGDPGIYGLAGLVLELLSEKGLSGPVEIEVIPGLSAANACAARLGAPLMHDFAVVSLSDRLTPWETIEARLRAAAEADFVIVLYNPRSRSRPEHLSRARRILLEYRSPETPVGIVKAAGRDGETVLLSTLGSLPEEKVDMQTTVIVGNSRTFFFGPWMITPRGYRGRRF